MIILSGAGTVEAGSITDPSELDDIWEWWEPGREAFADNDPIGQLTGQFAPGAGHNFTQSTSGERPTYKASILNGHGVARFDGVDNWLQNVNPSSLTAAHVFIVVKSAADPAASGDGGLWDLNGSNPLYAEPATGNILENMFRGTREVVSGLSDLDTWRVYEIVSTSSEYIMRLDGVQIGSFGANFTAGSNFRLGNNGFFFTEWFNGDVAGLYICSAKLTTVRTAIINYFNSRFGLSAS